MPPLTDEAPSGIVFDLDGTLLETEQLALQCFEAACFDIGVRVSRATYLACIGTTYERTAEILREEGGPEFPLEALTERWSAHYQTEIHARPVPFRPGIEDLLARLLSLELPLAVVTSSRRDTVETKLVRAGILDHFKFLICAGEASSGKPHPAPYIEAATRLGFAPADCWALEDSESGTRSAYDAGYRVFQIPDLLPAPERVLGERHVILESASALLHKLAR